MNNQIDLKLIHAAQAGRREALSALAEQAEADVYPFILRQTLDAQLAEDLTQDTLLDLVKALPRLSLKHPTFFWAWLYRTALGKVQHHFRLQGNKRLQAKTIKNDDCLKRISASESSGFGQLMKKERSRALLDSINTLSLGYRSVLTLRCYEQLSFAQIASITGQSELQARVQFFRAKRSLKKQLVRRGIDRDHLLASLSLFGGLTARLSEKGQAVPVKASLLDVGLGPTILGLTVSGPGLVCSLIALTLMTGSLLWISSAQTTLPSLRTLQTSMVLPSHLIAVSPTAGSSWQATGAQGRIGVTPGDIERFLLRPSPQNGGLLLLPADGWVDLGFPYPLEDGPGADVILDIIPSGSGPQLLLTDGGSQIFPLTELEREPTRGGFFLIGYDLKGLELGFVPIGLRLGGSGADNGGDCVFYEIKARVKMD